MTRLYLASRSPRRRQLLEEAGIGFSLLDISVDETIAPGVDPSRAARELALAKARAGAAQVSAGRVLGADTIVELQGSILGKPSDREDARAMLRSLSGGTHSVVTGVALVDAASGSELVDADSTRVTFKSLDPDSIAAYVETGEADDKAGAYAIQGGARSFVKALDGSLSNVVGLPMELLERMLAWHPSSD